MLLSTLAEAQYTAGDIVKARHTAARLATVMGGRDAQWLSLTEANQRQQRYDAK